MKHLIITLGLALSTGYTGPVHKENDKNTSTKETAEITASDINLNRQTNTYYVVNRRTGVPARNAAEAEQIADVSGPYGNVAYLGSSACRSLWLNKKVTDLPDSVTWSYYYSQGGTVTISGFYFILTCDQTQTF